MSTTMPLDAAELKTLVTVESYFLTHGSSQDVGGRWRCLRSASHTNGDAHPSVTISKGRAKCWSQDCFGDKGPDIFAVVGVVEHLSDFKSQRRRVQELAGVPVNSPHAARQILRRFLYRDGHNREAWKLRWDTDESGKKCTWARDPDGLVSGKGDCVPTLYELQRVMEVARVITCEGERDADTVNSWLADLGITDMIATTTPNGAGDVKADYLAPLAGKAMVYPSGDNDKGGRNYLAQCAERLRGQVPDLRILSVPESAKDWTDWRERGATAHDFHRLLNDAPMWTPDGAKPPEPVRVLYRRASEIAARPISWHWPGRIAKGKVSLIAGNPGLGKSQVTIDMAATTSTGRRWPDGTTCEIGNVVILSAEDDPSDTIRPRLEAAGADLTRVFLLDAVRDDTGVPGVVPRSFDLTTDLAKLATMLTAIGGASLIIIDPVTAYLGSTDSHKNAEVRALLSPLAELAVEHRAAIVAVSHFNKAANTEALMRVTGSLAFVAAARAAYVVAPDPENEARRLFLPLKNNLGNDRTGLAFTVAATQIASPAGQIDTSRVVWEAEPVTTTATEAMRPPIQDDERSELDDAKAFLQELLKDGPLSSKQIQADTEGAGHTWRTMRRAQKDLGVVAYKSGMREGWLWRLSTTLPPEGGQEGQKCEESPKNPVPPTWPPSHCSKTPEDGQVLSEYISNNTKMPKAAKIFGRENDGHLQAAFGGDQTETVTSPTPPNGTGDAPPGGATGATSEPANELNQLNGLNDSDAVDAGAP